MKFRLTIAFAVIVALVVSTLPQMSLGSSTVQIVDNTTAQSVNVSTGAPVNRSQTFSVSSQSVYSWLHLANITSPSHVITWIWLEPDGSTYSTYNSTVPDPGAGSSWSNYYAWSYINVSRHAASQIQGLWEVDIYTDGIYRLNQYFTIATTAIAIQPVEGFSWPTANIAVYIHPGPAWAIADVEAAMHQWNHSQAWFQNAYSLPHSPVLSLVVSNDSSSPVQISFNQTQTSSNWGWANYHYRYAGNGTFTRATCSVSLVLTLSGGTQLNDIAMQDLSEHELGHCLGLWHTASFDDLMNHESASFAVSRYPSTLNLYALYQLSASHQFGEIPAYYSLPGDIGYAFSPGVSTPNSTTTSSTSQSSTSVTTHASTTGTTSASATFSLTTQEQTTQPLPSDSGQNLLMTVGVAGVLAVAVLLAVVAAKRKRL